MLTEELQQKVQQLKDKYRRDDSPAQIEQLEADLSRLSDEREVLASPHFKRFAEEAEKHINDLNALLLNDDSLLSDKGLAIVRERALWRTMLSAFGAEYRDTALAALEAAIDEKLSN